MFRQKTPLKKFFWALLMVAGLATAACGSSGGTTNTNNSNSTDALTQKFLANYAAIVLASYTDSLNLAEDLRDAIQTFVNNPTQGNFDSAKAAWLQAREPYGQTEGYRFYDGPIDNDPDGPEPFINSWPLDEAVIDYTTGNPNGGLVNNMPAVEVNAENLSDLNTQDADDAIFTGYHAIEFLLWGQDLNQNPGDAGMRPYTDYVDAGTADNQDRRRAYLGVVGELLVEHLESLVAAWSENTAGNYRASFLNITPLEALRRTIVGVGNLAAGELAGERMSVALLTKDDEDEHSCFSDNTHRDILNNFKSIQNIYFGTYTRTDGTQAGDGTGLDDLFEAGAPELNQQMKEQLQIAQEAINGINTTAMGGVPFDEQVLGDDSNPNRQRVQTAVEALQTFGQLLSDAALELGVDINLDNNGE